MARQFPFNKGTHPQAPMYPQGAVGSSGGVAGSGTVGRIPIWNATGTLADSSIAEADGVVSLSQLDIGSVSSIAAALLRIGGDIRAAGGMFAGDFVLEGPGGIPGAGGTGSPVAIYDEGTLLTSEVTALRFTGAGVTATNSGGDVTVTLAELFTQAMADARYSLLGHTHLASQVTDFNAVGDVRWLQKTGGTLSGTLTVPTIALTGELSLASGGSTNFIRTIAAAGAYINQAEAGALIFRTGGKTMRFSTDSGATSALSLLTDSSVRVWNYLRFDTTYGQSIVGAYDPTKYRGIYAMGDSFKMDVLGANLGTLYGLYFGYDGSGGIAITSYALGHGFGLAQNGSTMAYFGASGMWHSGFIRAGGTYGYTMGDSAAGGARLRYGAVVSGYYDFINSGNGFAGLAASALQFGVGAPRFESIDANSIKFQSGSTNAVMAIHTGDGTRRGYMAYADTSGFGWLHSGGSWLLRNPYGTLDLIAGNNVTAHDFILA